VALIETRADRPVGPADQRISGGFIEHLGRCSYRGVFDEGSPRSDALGAPPVVFVFLLAQRQIVEGVAVAGLK
jgi:alpha-L-arabinofuranosidase